MKILKNLPTAQAFFDQSPKLTSILFWLNKRTRLGSTISRITTARIIGREYYVNILPIDDLGNRMLSMKLEGIKCTCFKPVFLK